MSTVTPPPGIAQTATRPEMAAAAAKFVLEWSGETRERAEKDSFWNEFFEIFGISRRRVGGVFEYVAKRHSTGRDGSMDLFWPGRIAVEHKSADKSLTEAMDQLVDYLLTVEENDLPQLAVVCDFKTFIVRDFDSSEPITFKLEELPAHLDLFTFLAGYRRGTGFVDEEQANLKATELLANLHDQLKAYGYPVHDLRVLLVRLLYVLFADDTQIWQKNLFEDYIRVHTAEDGSDLGSKLRDLFEVLNQEHRMSNLPPELDAFEYVNGGLFEEPIKTPICDAQIRRDLLQACHFDWSEVSPVIFGSLFQNVMTSTERRNLGAHFTTERDILRTLRPLFLDSLELELADAKIATTGRLNRLREFRAKLPTMQFLDPACGCGNFLMVAFQNLRRLELEVQLAIRDAEGASVTGVFNIDLLRQVTLNQFHGIELEEFPARIAQTAMHLTDHKANMEMSAAFGEYVPSLPLSNSANITTANSLDVDWNETLPAAECTYIVGNPPFVGLSYRSESQTADMVRIWGADYHGTLDYVTSWYQKALDYMADYPIRAALVSTNSICQGEQVAPMWGPLLARDIQIDFAHRPFSWVSEARGRAQVHVVIIGFSKKQVISRRQKLTIYDYPNPKSEPIPRQVSRINPYLVEGRELVVTGRSTPLSPDLPPVRYGNKPTDGKNFQITSEELPQFQSDPIAAKYVRPYVGAKELLHDLPRWCLWLSDASSSDIRASKLLSERVEAIRRFRLNSKAQSTNDAARSAHLFRQVTQPDGDYICIPIHVSESRGYFPVKSLPAEAVASNANFIADDPDGVLFAVISSSWFIAWQNAIGGRLESRLRFNKFQVWNTFPLPALTKTHRKRITDAGRGVLAAREALPGQSLADMYAEGLFDPGLAAAHDALDRTLDKVLAPRRRITTEADRLGVLFSLYEAILQDGQLTL